MKAAAGKFSEDQILYDGFDQWGEEWITWDNAPKFEKGMFVAKVSGNSMEPLIPDGAYCLFRQPRAGTRQNKVVLVWNAGISDRETGGKFTVKIYESKKIKCSRN